MIFNLQKSIFWWNLLREYTNNVDSLIFTIINMKDNYLFFIIIIIYILFIQIFNKKKVIHLSQYDELY